VGKWFEDGRQVADWIVVKLRHADPLHFPKDRRMNRPFELGVDSYDFVIDKL